MLQDSVKPMIMRKNVMTENVREKKKLVIGILAHVDAGKTTLAESMLYLSGSIRKLGRVDHKDAFLDTFELERERGITIFSKQAVLTFENLEISLLDTPGHVDFSTEMERTLQVLDYAILVISGSDGIQGHTETLWRLLARYQIPTFLFINKMDMEGTERSRLIRQIKTRLNDGCIEFGEEDSSGHFMEAVAMSDETLLDHYIAHEIIETKDIARMIAKRNIFPCYFGSALKLFGVEELLAGIAEYTQHIPYPEEFGAKVYKIARDEQGNRLTYMKITGGSLRVKKVLTNANQRTGDQQGIWEEKIDQIRIYSGARYDASEEVFAGCVCAVTGLSSTYPGEGLGTEAVSDIPFLEPVLNYQIILPPECDPHSMLSKLRQLEEEDPLLHIMWSDQLKEIHVKLMGEVQVEILKSLILQRFGIPVQFGTGNIVYKETILEPVVGLGHFEPLRHYAEVHLLMEPGDQGSGLVVSSNCSEDELDRNWQRLILTHLEEKEHVGVLTGAPITDMKITLIAGRAHQKHTEGGDFRQATYRAVRQGLQQARCALLEPFYSFRLEIPSEVVGRAMSDIQRMNGTFGPPEMQEDKTILTGSAPVSTMRSYQMEVTAYTRGRGRLICTLKGFEPCHNADEVISQIGYDRDGDYDNPSGSVFCSHGAGFVVAWDQVQAYMHGNNGWQPPQMEVSGERSLSFKQTLVREQTEVSIVKNPKQYGGSLQEDQELEQIFVRTFGPLKQKKGYSPGGLGYETKPKMESSQRKQLSQLPPKIERKEYLLVDGYNIIFSWEELQELAKESMDAARIKLMDILSNYQGFKKCILILVFDAYKVKGGVGSVVDYHNIHVVYTREAETADQYIEKVTRDMRGKHQVTVATSDALEQMIILGNGALRCSANDLKEEILRVRELIRRDYLDKPSTGKAYLKEQFHEDILEFLRKDNPSIS